MPTEPQDTKKTTISGTLPGYFKSATVTKRDDKSINNAKGGRVAKSGTFRLEKGEIWVRICHCAFSDTEAEGKERREKNPAPVTLLG